MASLISPQIKKQYFDSNGDPLTGGKLFIYEAGTTTPVTSYIDAAESSSNANPIILDSRGEIDGLWLRVGSYKLVLKDSNDVTIWTEDSITIRDVGTELDDLSTEITSINTVIATGTRSNRIASGAVSTESTQSRFLLPIGSTNQVKTLGTSVNLVYFVEGVQHSIISDFVASGLVSPPLTNNTASVNDANLSDNDATKTLGEFGTAIPYDGAGSEITSLNGSVAGFKISNGSTSEYFIARVDNTNSQLTEAQRGYFFGSDGNPIERISFSDNDTITLMKLTWLYLKSNGNILASYDEPYYSTTMPTGVSDGTMWFDVGNDKWKRWNSTTFEDAEVCELGLCVQDENGNTVGARGEYFYSENSETNTVEVSYRDTTSIKSKSRNNIVAVLGNILRFNNSYLIANIVSDLQDGETEAASTTYYWYIKENGDKVISPVAPLDMRGRLQGFYHSYESWRYIGKVFNNSSLDFEGSSVESSPEQISRAQEGSVINLTTSATISIKNDIVICDATSGAITVGLPSAVISKGRQLFLNKNDSSANTVVIEGYGSESIGAFSSITLNDQNSNCLLVSNGSSWAILSKTVEKVFIKDHKGSGVDSGSFTTGAWRKRDLNTVTGATGIVSLNSSVITLVPGHYSINWRAPVYDGVGGHSSRLYDADNATEVITGSSDYSGGSSGGTSTASVGKGEIRVTTETDFELQHICSITKATDGFGKKSGLAANEVYAQIEITKII